MTSLRVALIHHYSITHGGGGEKMLKSIATELARRGHAIDIYALPFRRGPNNKNIMHVSEFGYRESITANIECDVAYFFYVPFLHRLFYVNSPKIAGIHSFICTPRFAHVRTRLSEFIRHHGLLSTITVLYEKMSRNSDLLQFNAIHIPNLVSPLHLSNVPTYNIPNWLDTEVYRPLGDKGEKFTVAFVGRAAWQKGWDIYLEIVGVLRRKAYIQFLSVGSYKENALVKTFPYISSEDEMARIYSSAHVLVYPSRADIFGLTLIEALACGTPVLTSALPSHKAFLPEDYICENTAEYVKKILALYRLWRSDEDSYYVLSQRCREIALRFDKKKIFPLFERMLLEVADS